MLGKIILFLSILLYPLCSNNDKESVKEYFHKKDDFEKAQKIYKENCASCHGETGMGDGVASIAFNPKPRNFHLPTEKWVNGKTLEGVTKTLTVGIKPNMWAYTGNPEDIPYLAKYVIILGNTSEGLMNNLHEKYK
jgi:mono/diheme cytochrome c family protein